MAAKMPELNYSCEICGVEGLNDDDMRSHMMVYHVDGAASCPFCDLGDVSAEEMMMHVNSAHLDYLTPEQELLAFIDDDDDSDEAGMRRSPWALSPAEPKQNGWANNINNNNNYCTMVSGAGSSGANASMNSSVNLGAGHGSPMRSQLALNLRTNASPSNSATARKPTPQQCPMCSYTSDSPLLLEEHINRQHFDLMSPSFPVVSPPPREAAYTCPLCIRTFQNSPDLELHVNIEHKDILSPAKPSSAQSSQSVENWTDSCPVCSMSNFKNNAEMVSHIEDHFNQRGMSPMTPDVSSDRMLAREIEKREREVRRQREQREFELLRAQYGMDNQGNFKEQSLTNMQKAVYAGEMSVADYYERQIELRAAESSGIDDGSSCTKTLVPKIRGISSNSLNVIRTLMCTTVDHYASTYGDKGWGCGYRNMQMMLSSLLHHTGYNEQLYGGLYGMRPPNNSRGMCNLDVPGRAFDSRDTGSRNISEMPGRSTMPSISRLQQHIEWAWTQGFDVQGSDQLGGKLFNTRKWIGATEVVTVLSSLRIRCQLVDFHRPTSPGGGHPDLFNWVLQYFQKNDDFKPPLYLQHQGHSRTIVGVEEHKDGGLFLLVFDPSHSPQQMGQFRNTSTATAAMRLIRKSQAAMKARQYQLVAVLGIMETEHEYQQSKLLRSVRVPQDR